MPTLDQELDTSLFDKDTVGTYQHFIADRAVKHHWRPELAQMDADRANYRGLAFLLRMSAPGEGTAKDVVRHAGRVGEYLGDALITLETGKAANDTLTPYQKMLQKTEWQNDLRDCGQDLAWNKALLEKMDTKIRGRLLAMAPTDPQRPLLSLALNEVIPGLQNLNRRLDVGVKALRSQGIDAFGTHTGPAFLAVNHVSANAALGLPVPANELSAGVRF